MAANPLLVSGEERVPYGSLDDELAVIYGVNDSLAVVVLGNLLRLMALSLNVVPFEPVVV